jgi:hypothetical protein
VADSMNVRITVLWCHELRVAARALHRARTLLDDESASKEARREALADALEAAGAALNSDALLGDGPIVTAEAPLWITQREDDKEDRDRG